MQGCDDLGDELTMLKCLLPFLLLPSLDPVFYWVMAACQLHSGTLQEPHSSTDSCKSGFGTRWKGGSRQGLGPPIPPSC